MSWQDILSIAGSVGVAVIFLWLFSRSGGT